MAQPMPKPPILPRSTSDPIAQNARIRRAEADFKARLAQLSAAVERLYMPALVGGSQLVRVTNRQYDFLLDPSVLNMLGAELQRTAERLFLEGGPDALWYSLEYVLPAYAQGTAQQLANLGQQSPVYAASRPNLQALVETPAYQRRIGYLRARQFELMEGFTGDVVKSVAIKLSDGMAQGLNPREVARTLASEVRGQQYRANRIARTEIGNALRQARMDESDQAYRELGIRTLEMHVSAFSPTTRVTHSARSGTLHTTQEQRAWWSRDGNSVNCKCSTVSVLVDENGNPVTPGVIERAKQVKKRMLDKRPQLAE